jgi:hypothetical protein
MENDIFHSDKNGDIVEGALACILYDISDDRYSEDGGSPAQEDDDGIPKRKDLIWQIIRDHKPTDIHAFKQAWEVEKLGYYAPLDAIFGAHGINRTPNDLFKIISKISEGSEYVDLKLANIDGSGSKEIIAHSYFDGDDVNWHLSAYRWDSTQNRLISLSGNVLPWELTPTIGAPISIGDIDNDGRDEIFLENKILGYNPASGKIEIENEFPVAYLVRPVGLYDVDNDGIKEYCIHKMYNWDYVEFWRVSGSNFIFMNQVEVPNRGELAELDTIIAVGDTDNDGLNEIVVANGNGWDTGSFFIYKHNNGVYTRVFEKSSFGNFITDLLIEDYDNDGLNEVLLSNSQNGTIHAFQWNGSNYVEEYTYTFGGYSGTEGNPSIAVGNVDDNVDGLKEIIVGLGGHCSVPEVGSGLWVFGNINRMVLYDDNLDGMASVLIYDINNDGFNEIIAGSRDKKIYVLGKGKHGGDNNKPAIASNSQQNYAPVYVADKTVNFFVSAIDSDLDQLHYHWYIDEKPVYSDSGSTSQYTYTPGQSEVGERTIELIVSDTEKTTKLQWNALIVASQVVCQCDFNKDGDVDGGDIAFFIKNSLGFSLSDLAEDFSRENCPIQSGM